MTRYYQTEEGRFPYTAEEEAAADVTEAEANAMVAERLRLKYKEDRKAEYDNLNQFEMQFDDERDGTTTWVDAINAIKARHPKE
jgi:hypothetical protein